MGLPRSKVPLALLMFNVGVEVGQLLFVSPVLLLERGFRVLEARWPRWDEAVPAYGLGSLGACWTIQRVVILLAGLLITALSCGPTEPWSHSGRYGSASGGGSSRRAGAT